MSSNETQIYCIQPEGIRPRRVGIEISSHFQVPQFLIVGLPSTEIGEAKERVRSAILNSALPFPNRRVIVNLSPAFMHKSGTGMDLGIALGVLLKHSLESIPFQRILAWGELSLGGKLQSAPHTLHAIYHSFLSPDIDCIVIPNKSNIPDAFLNHLIEKFPERASQLSVIKAKDLESAMEALTHLKLQTRFIKKEAPLTQSHDDSQLSLPSQGLTRILGATLAGEHHLMMLGPKGVGKSHSIEILSKLFEPSHIDTQVDRFLTNDLFTDRRTDLSPVRFVGVQVKPQALHGSFRGTKFQPGECSLAHGGLLIADEFPEWNRDSKECLRHPLERGSISINRVNGIFDAPAQFQLIASGNLCPCGGSPWENPPSCICKLPEKERYRKHLSGPILDRIDFFVLVSQSKSSGTEKVSVLKQRITETRARLLSQSETLPSHWSGDQIENEIKSKLSHSTQELLKSFASIRSEHKVIRTAHTLSAWDGVRAPTLDHFKESAKLRPEQWI
ncbi:MAG: ATP-binding protein [Xanthomonadaceae bacterium]|nr:ATP-binding protein [Xanthomonadaceae bacterium]